MKRISINLFAVCIALCIGLAINSACGDTLSDTGTIESPQNIEDLTQMVLTLQSEMDKLKSDFSKLSDDLKNTQAMVQELELQNKELQNLIKGVGDSGESPSISSDMFYIDGLWYSHTGFASGRIKTVNSIVKTTSLNGEDEVISSYKVPATYEYDEYDRVVKINYDYSYAGYKYYVSAYTYNGKVVTNTTEYATDNTKYSQVSETEYY